jgi:hypothetical protein
MNTRCSVTLQPAGGSSPSRLARPCLDSRPYELAIARAYRAPQAVQAYRAELAIGGWPLSELEETAIEPVYRAFRVAMAAWEIERGRIAADYDLAAIERQLARTGTPAP